MFTKNLTRIIFSLSLALIILSVVLGSLILFIDSKSKDFIYSDINNLPYNKVGLVPGCNKYIAPGVLNIYYTQRINTTYKLFKAGKIDFILLSGDNALVSYDEPTEMKKSLIELGVPKEKIFLDYAGFRTLDTIIRANKVFQLDSVTFISQSFQNQRGVFIGEHQGMNIVAFNADYDDFENEKRIIIREFFAKIKMMLDLYIINKEPKFLGDLITIGD